MTNAVIGTTYSTTFSSWVSINRAEILHALNIATLGPCLLLQLFAEHYLVP